MTTAAEIRARQAIALASDMNDHDRDSIVRARRTVAEEIRLGRHQLMNLAQGAYAPKELTALFGTMAEVVDRLQRLAARLDELERLSKAALQAQVDADPETAGATVQDDGRITGVNLKVSGARADAFASRDDEGPEFGRHYAVALRAGYSPAGARTYARQELEGRRSQERCPGVPSGKGDGLRRCVESGEPIDVMFHQCAPHFGRTR